MPSNLTWTYCSKIGYSDNEKKLDSLQLNYAGKNYNISTYQFLFIIGRFKCYYTHFQETALNYFFTNISIKVDIHITVTNKLSNKIKQYCYENKWLKY